MSHPYLLISLFLYRIPFTKCIGFLIGLLLLLWLIGGGGREEDRLFYWNDRGFPLNPNSVIERFLQLCKLISFCTPNKQQEATTHSLLSSISLSLCERAVCVWDCCMRNSKYVIVKEVGSKGENKYLITNTTIGIGAFSKVCIAFEKQEYLEKKEGANKLCAKIMQISNPM